VNEPRLILHFETTNRTDFTNLAWVDACGAGQNLQDLQDFSWVDTSFFDRESGAALE